MPLYVYECTECKNRFEIRQRMSDDPITVCPNCGGRVRRVLQPVGIIFKGSGFYSTDNRSSSWSGPAATATSDEKSNGDKSGTEKSTTTTTEPSSVPPKTETPKPETTKSDSGTSTT